MIAPKGTAGGALRKLGLNVLFLDEDNPRLPGPLQGARQRELVRFMVERYNAIEVATSIARHGYFNSEPLIAIPRRPKNGRATWTVVEGNRRLAALMCLARESLRAELKNKSTWDRLAKRAELPITYPVIVAEKRANVWPIIGFRHISGIEPWRPLQKARFIYDMSLVARDFALVAAEVGESETSVRSHFRNFCIYKQADEDFDIDVENLEDNFGTFTRAMSSIPIRSYIGAPDPRDVSMEREPIPLEKKGELRNVLSWLFGLPGEDPVVPESRNVSDLAVVLQDAKATRVLVKYRDLGRAAALTGVPLDRLKRSLDQAERHLSASLEDIEQYSSDSAVRRRVRSVATLARQLSAHIKR
jgi:hypothetical protein